MPAEFNEHKNKQQRDKSDKRRGNGKRQRIKGKRRISKCTDSDPASHPNPSTKAPHERAVAAAAAAVARVEARYLAILAGLGEYVHADEAHAGQGPEEVLAGHAVSHADLDDLRRGSGGGGGLEDRPGSLRILFVGSAAPNGAGGTADSKLCRAHPGRVLRAPHSGLLALFACCRELDERGESHESSRSPGRRRTPGAGGPCGAQVGARKRDRCAGQKCGFSSGHLLLRDACERDEFHKGSPNRD